MRRMIDVKLYAERQQEAWITPTLLSGWGPYDSHTIYEGYYKDSLGIVHIALTVSGSGADESLVFILPSGYRPSGLILSRSSNNTRNIDIYATGLIYISGNIGSPSPVTILMSFRAGV